MVKIETVPNEFFPVLEKIRTSLDLSQYSDIKVTENRHIITSPEELHKAMLIGDITKDGKAPLSLINDHCKAQLAFLGILMQSLYPNNMIRNTGYFVYHKNGFMRWHTNSNEEGKRVYITYPYGEAEFKYWDRDEKKIKVIQENKLIWQMKSFIVSKQSLLWHSVSTEDLRLSVGYNII